MRLFSRIALLFGLCFIFPTAPGQAEVLDRIVATVNGDIITLREVDNRLATVVKISGIQDQTKINQLRRDVLQAMIDRILTLQEGRRLGIQVMPQEVDEAIERLKKANNVTQEQLEEEIKRGGRGLEGFREDMRAEIIKARLIDREVRRLVVVTEEEINDYLLKEKGVYAGELKIALRHIHWGLPQAATEEVVKTKMAEASEIYDKLKGRLDFGKAVTMYSQAADAKEGGHLGALSLEEMSETVRNALKDLKEGDVSPPLHIGNSIQIFQVYKIIKPGQSAVAVATPEEREKVRGTLVEQKLNQKYTEFMTNLRENAMISIKF